MIYKYFYPSKLNRCCTKTLQTLTVVLSYTLLSIVLTSCSSDDDNNNFDHSHAQTIDLEKHLFEHELAQQCIAKETAKVMNQQASQKRVADRCMCIATHLFKDLAVKDSYALLNDKKQAQALRRKYEEATNQCR